MSKMHVRRDVAREINDALDRLGGAADFPGVLELAVRESDRRDEMERDPGHAIREIVDAYVARELGPGIVLDDTVRRILLKKLDAGEPFDLREWHQASVELKQEAPGRIVSFKTKILREHDGQINTTTISFSD
jgi:hypothetical protein